MEIKQILTGVSLSFDVGLAETLGIDCAILFQHIVFWLRYNVEKKPESFVDGFYWMYETQKDMASFIKVLSEDQVQRAIKKLIEEGILIKKNMGKNPFDRTCWYTLVDQSFIVTQDKNKKVFTKPQNCGIASASARNPIPQSCGIPSRNPAESLIKETKEEQKENNLSVVGAVAPPVEVSEKPQFEDEGPLPPKVTILKGDGTKEVVTQSQLYERIVRQRCDFSAEAIRYSWLALCTYQGVVHDWWRFIEGTAKNYAKVKKSNLIKEKQCKNKNKRLNSREENSSSHCKEASSEKDSLEQLSQTYVCIADLLPTFPRSSRTPNTSSSSSARQEPGKPTCAAPS